VSAPVAIAGQKACALFLEASGATIASVLSRRRVPTALSAGLSKARRAAATWPPGQHGRGWVIFRPVFTMSLRHR
jgi:hypothetical protein